MLTQLQPQIWIQTPKGRALAVAIIDYGPDWNLLWVAFDQKTGESWCWSNEQVRADKNITLGIALPDAP